MTIETIIEKQIKDNPIIIYMKGTPDMAMCGFSARTVAVLESYNVPFAHVNILDYPEIRSTLPKMMNWPTFPQVYVNGELIGGCDIVCEMHESGELEEILSSFQQ